MGRKIVLLVAGAAVLVLGMALLGFGRSTPQRLPDGTLLELTDLKFGPTNTFKHGAWLERILGGLIPSNGIHVAGVDLQRRSKVGFGYTNSPFLTAQFRLSGRLVDYERSEFMSPKFHRQFRLTIIGDDEFPVVPHLLPAKEHRDGIFVYVHAWAFPRSARVLRFRIEQHDQALAPWRTVAEFIRRNPARATERNWTAEAYPVERTSGGLSVVLGEVTVELRHTNRWESFWQHTVTTPIRITENGVLLTNWGAHQLMVEDSSGNELGVGGPKRVQDGWIVYEGFRSADPSKVWRLRAGFALDSDYPATNLHTLTVPVPLARPFTTNVAGYPLEIGFVNTDMLSVQLLTNAPDLRLAFVAARDENGKDIDFQAGSYSQFKFWRAMSLPFLRSSGPPPASGTITATIAISRNVPLEFTVKPRLIGGRADPPTNR
jgi:hypothetical protein